MADITKPGEDVQEGRLAITVEIDIDSVEELDTVHCPICTAIDPFYLDDYEYQCQACGAIFMVMRGRQDLDEESA